MASIPKIKFIESALFATGSFAMSYTDPDQRCLIRNHLILLLQDFPNFEVSTNTFTHNDGTTVNLLCLHGHLHPHISSKKLPSVPLTIWVHENYPFMPPLVFITSRNQSHICHPFVDISGFANPPYIQTWEHPRSNLLELMRQLVKIFSHDHPLARTNSKPTHSSSLSKMEALDRLTAMTYHKVASLRTSAEKEIDDLSKLQTEMMKRSKLLNGIVGDLETERKRLKEKLREIEDGADVLVNWLKVNNPKSTEAVLGDLALEEMFQGVDDESKTVIESLASDRSIEDVIFVMDKAVEEGNLSCGSYIRQVRVLAREQFFHRAKHVRFGGEGF